MKLNIKNLKLKNIPKILYLNDDNNIKQKDYIEQQLNYWEIDNYQRISTSKYSVKNYKKWKNIVSDKKLLLSVKNISKTVNHLNAIIEWYDNDDSEFCIIMEDNINIGLAEYWIFDWDTLMKNLPYNWDCICLFVEHPKTIPMHLKQKTLENKCSSCYMITRQFAKKIKQHHYQQDGKFKLHINTKNLNLPEYEYGTIDSFLYELGITYTLPVFNLNTRFIDDPDEDDDQFFNSITKEMSSEAIEYWWKVKSKTFSTYEFFTYNKRFDWKMEASFDVAKKHVFKERDLKPILWI